MRRSQLAKLYATVYRVDPATGKERAVSRYIGKYYQLDGAARCKLVRRVWLGWCLAVAAFGTAGFIPARAGSFVGVSLWYMCCLLPLFYLLMAAIRLTHLGEKITELDKAEGFASASHSGWSLAVLGSLWVATDAVLLAARGLPNPWWADVLFLACGALTAVTGVCVAKSVKKVKVFEME